MSSQLQNKLLHYEVPPPEGVWDKITSSLDENLSLSLAEKLYQYEAQPPAAVWQNLVQQLDAAPHNKAKVVPFYARYRRPLKYSGAVAIFIFLAVMTSLFISKRTESELPAEGIVQNNLIKKDSAKTPGDSQENTSLKQEKENNKKERVIAKSKISRADRQVASISSSFIEDYLPQQAERNEIVRSSIDADKYMMYSDGEGNVIRLPKKTIQCFCLPNR